MNILETIKLCKSYSQAAHKIKILNELDFAIEAGQSCAIIGQSGCGKSTLLSVLAGLDSIDSGQLTILGHDLKTMNEDQLANFRSKHLGFVFQNFQLMPQLTALENISLSLELLGSPLDEAQNKAAHALEDLRISHRKNHFPSQLSGGEQQRVAIARALIHQPDIIFADEPSGNLDPENSRHVMDIFFERIAKSKSTLILVTHNYKLAERCQKVYRLANGKVLEGMD